MVGVPPQVAVFSVDAAISGCVAQLKQCSLLRSTAAAQLLSRLLSAGLDSSRGGGGEAASQQSASAGGSSGGHGWVQVVSFEAELQPPSPRGSPSKHQNEQQQQQQQHEPQLAVSGHYYDTALLEGHGGLGPAQQRCSIAVGRVVLAHAPGFAANLALFVGEYSDPGSACSSSGGDDNTLVQQTQPRTPPALLLAANGDADASSGSSSSSSSPSLLEQLLQSQLLLECRVSRLDLAVLSSQAPDASAALLTLRQLAVHGGGLDWEAPWSSHLRHSLLAPPQGTWP